MTNVVSKKFFKFDETDLDATISAKLTLNELNLWLYLCLLEPFGDRPVELPPFEVIERKLNISKSSYYSAKAKLQKVGLWNFTEKHTVALNLRGHVRTNEPDSAHEDSFRESGTDSRNQDSIPENRTQFLKSGTDSNFQENRDSEPREDKGSSVSQTLQTSQTFSYSPYGDGEKEKKDKQKTVQEDYATERNVSTNTQNVENVSSSSQNLNQETQVSTLDLNQDKNYGGCSINAETNNEGNGTAIAVVKPQLRTNYQNPVQQINWQWLPHGAWKTPEGKLDPHFQEWFAKIFFVEQFGHEFNLAVANVESYFRNDLRRLPSRWKQYHKEYVAKLKNTSMLLDHGVKIPEERRKNTINRVRAIQPVASEQSVSTNPTPVNSNLQSLESIVNSVTTPEVNPQNILNPAVEELEAEVIEAETITDPWIESEETESSALTQIEVKDETQIQETSFTPKYVKIDNSDCPDPEVISVVYRDFTGIAEQMEKERREAPPINPLAKAMIEDFTTIISGKPVDRPVGERIEIINYALSHSGRNKYFFAQAQQFVNQGWKVDFNDEGEPLYIHPDSEPDEFTDSENEDVVIDSDIDSDKESNTPDSIETLPNSNSDTESKDLKNSTSPKRKYSKLVSNLMSKAEKLNEILKIECARKSRHFLAQVQEFINLGWMVDYNDEGEPIEVYQF